MVVGGVTGWGCGGIMFLKIPWLSATYVVFAQINREKIPEVSKEKHFFPPCCLSED